MAGRTCLTANPHHRLRFGCGFWSGPGGWPGNRSALDRAVGGSCVFLNDAIWESVDHFRKAFSHPDFRNSLEAYSAVPVPHLFQKSPSPTFAPPEQNRNSPAGSHAAPGPRTWGSFPVMPVVEEEPLFRAALADHAERGVQLLTRFQFSAAWGQFFEESPPISRPRNDMVALRTILWRISNRSPPHQERTHLRLIDRKWPHGFAEFPIKKFGIASIGGLELRHVENNAAQPVSIIARPAAKTVPGAQ